MQKPVAASFEQHPLRSIALIEQRLAVIEDMQKRLAVHLLLLDQSGGTTPNPGDLPRGQPGEADWPNS